MTDSRNIADIFLCVVTSATEVGNLRPSAERAESVAKIHDVGFYCLTSSAWDEPTSGYDPASSPTFDQMDAFRDGHSGTNTPNGAVYEHPCSPLAKIISAGTFYHAAEPHWDISSRLSHRLKRDPGGAKDVGIYDDRFIWNEYIVRSLLNFRERLDPQERDELDACQFIVGDSCSPLSVLMQAYQVLVIQGYVGIFTLPLPAPPTNGTPVIATISLISRLSWKRAGTRFNTRGVDDDGNCANFVEVIHPYTLP